MISKPLFLVGSERSGTTLLRLMLDHHPSISLHHEFELCVDRVADDGTFPPVREFLEWIETLRGVSEENLEIDASLSYPELVDSFLEQKRRLADKPLIGATVHRHFDRLLHIWPDARFIHLLRDGRDVARSCLQMGNWYGEIWSACGRWIEAETTWDRLAERIDSSRHTTVRYEDLIRQPKESLTALCDFIGVPFDEAMFGYAETSTYGLPDPKAISQWSRKLPERDIRLIEARLGDLLVQRGYQRSGLPPLEVGPLKELGLRLKNKAKSWQFRSRRYGFLLLAAEKGTRWSPLKPLNRRFLAAKNAIDAQYIK